MDWRDAHLGGHVNPGWEPLVDELHRRVLELDPDIVIDQVKEKFAALRYYYNCSDPGKKIDTPWEEGKSLCDVLENLVQQAETVSLWTCEVCGKPGWADRHGHGWLNTLCAEHSAIRRTKGTPAWKMAEELQDQA